MHNGLQYYAMVKYTQSSSSEIYWIDLRNQPKYVHTCIEFLVMIETIG